MKVTTTVNGQPEQLDIDDCELLLDMLRERLFLTGAKRSCDVQICGACTVLVDGMAVSACSTLAGEADGKTVQTVEGLADGEVLNAVQRAFVEAGAMQCGYCTPGFVMSVQALLSENPSADAETIASYLEGNICRCGGYQNILKAVQAAQRELSAE